MDRQRLPLRLSGDIFSSGAGARKALISEPPGTEADSPHHATTYLPYRFCEQHSCEGQYLPGGSRFRFM